MSSSSIQLTKAALRTELKQRLRSITSEEKLKQSKIVSDLVINSPEYNSSQRISVYLSMPEEIQTNDIVAHILKTGKQCFIPRYSGNNMEMLRLQSLEDYDNLPRTNWNIKQPGLQDTSREEAITSGGLDLIILPGLGFSYNSKTDNWARLGRGKGYYDTYLQQFEKLNLKAPLTVGLAFKEQVLEEIPTLAHDKQLSCVFHP